MRGDDRFGFVLLARSIRERVEEMPKEELSARGANDDEDLMTLDRSVSEERAHGLSEAAEDEEGPA